MDESGVEVGMGMVGKMGGMALTWGMEVGRGFLPGAWMVQWALVAVRKALERLRS
jgi:hypothetical protein